MPGVSLDVARLFAYWRRTVESRRWLVQEYAFTASADGNEMARTVGLEPSILHSASLLLLSPPCPLMIQGDNAAERFLCVLLELAVARTYARFRVSLFRNNLLITACISNRVTMLQTGSRGSYSWPSRSAQQWNTFLRFAASPSTSFPFLTTGRRRHRPVPEGAARAGRRALPRIRGGVRRRPPWSGLCRPAGRAVLFGGRRRGSAAGDVDLCAWWWAAAAGARPFRHDDR